MVKPRCIKKIAEFSDHYRREILNEEYLKKYHDVDVKRLRDDWWEALKFFFSRVLYQGRRDDLSYEVERRIRTMLGKYFNDPQLKDQEFDRLRQQGWHRLQEDLKEVVGKGKVGRGRDIELVIGTLEFISHIPDKNIVNHSVCRIEKGELKELWKSLQKSESGTGIKSVGEKTASLFLRDLVTLLDLEPKISEGWECLQPIDTWVRKVCEKVGIEEKRNLRKSIVDVCNSQGVSPVKFNMGAWYVGYHALDVLLDLLRASQQSRGTHGQIKYTKSSTNTENG